MEKQTKFNDLITNAVVDRDSKKRTMTFVVSTEDINRYGHKVMVEGWNLNNYKNNPVVLMNHNDNIENVVGNATRVWKDNKNKRLMATVKFLDEGISPTADLAHALYDGDYLNSTSPGYIVDYEKATFGKSDKDPKVTFNGQELIEISLAVLPANPNAVKQSLKELDYIKNAIELGDISEDLVDRVESQLHINKTEEVVDEVDDVEEDDVLLDVEEETVTDEDNIYKDFYSALDMIIKERIENNDPDIIAGRIVESLENADSNKTLDSDFDSFLSGVLNNDKEDLK